MAGRALHSLLLNLIIIGLVTVQTVESTSAPPRLALYVFGDSTFDVGNNNFLPNTTVVGKANYPNYGVDFKNSMPTGRFSNGFNTADELAKNLGFSVSPPPFLSLPQNLTPVQIVMGVNFASGGSGIQDQTGQILVKQYISMSQQVQNFATVSSKLTHMIGQQKAANFLSSCLFLISTGSNDLLEFSFDEFGSNETLFLANLASTYEQHLRVLYYVGARKFGILSVPPVGCAPSQRSRNVTGGCYDQLNQMAANFYSMMNTVLRKLQSELPGMKYALGDTFGMVNSIIQNPKHPGFKEVKYACCGNGTFNGQNPCLPELKFCSDRGDYLFWDWFHPTEAASKMAALYLYAGFPIQTFVTPITFKQLAEA